MRARRWSIVCAKRQSNVATRSCAIRTGLGLGESISKFMQRLGSGDRVFVILSDKYLKSPYCMYELLEVWRNCKAEDEVFRQRIRVFRLPDAKMLSPLERRECAEYWEEQFTELDELVQEERRACWARRTSIATS